MTDLPSVSNSAQRCENVRKNSFLNYESPALTAELQALCALTRELPISNVQRPIFTARKLVGRSKLDAGKSLLTISIQPDGV